MFAAYVEPAGLAGLAPAAAAFGHVGIASRQLVLVRRLVVRMQGVKSAHDVGELLQLRRRQDAQDVLTQTSPVDLERVRRDLGALVGQRRVDDSAVIR